MLMKMKTGQSLWLHQEGPHLCGPSVELPGIETEALPVVLGFELLFRSVRFRFSPARYLRFRFRVFTASMLTIYCPGS
jgi:hypothetical protein